MGINETPKKYEAIVTTSIAQKYFLNMSPHFIEAYKKTMNIPIMFGVLLEIK